MFDFTTTSITQSGIIICTVFYLAMIALYWKPATIAGACHTRKSTRVLFLFVLIFAIMSWTNGDWIHYKEYIQNSDVSNDSMEDFYNWLKVVVSSNYLLFRIVVWGSALVLLFKAINFYGVSGYPALFFLFAIFINYFDYSRNALGLAVYFFGLSVFLSDKSWFVRLLGIGILCCATYFHRSTLALVLLTPLCIFPINKKTVFPIIICLIVAFAALKGLFLSFMDNAMNSDNTAIANKTSFYLNQERGEMVSGSLIGILTGYWKYSVFYVLFAVDTIILFRNEVYRQLPFRIKALYNIMAGILILSLMIYYFNVGHLALYYRFLMMMYVPLTVITVYLFTRKIITRRTYLRLLMYCGGYVAFEFLYRSAIGV